MVVEKREGEGGGSKKKMVVGGLLVDFRKPGDFYCFSTIDREDSKIVYYVLDLNTGEVSSLPPTLVKSGSHPSIAVVGSRIYAFGAAKSPDSRSDSDFTQPQPKPNKKKNNNNNNNNNQNQGSWSCHMVHLTKPKDGWKLATPAAAPDNARVFWPEGVVEFRGKLYVFDNSANGFVCEVFDPNQCQWRRLKSPPFPFPPSTSTSTYRGVITQPVMPDLKNNRILMYFQDLSTIYAYYPCEDQWRCAVDNFNGWLGEGEPVALGDNGVIFIYDRALKHFFRAYDPLTKQWLSVRLSPQAQADSVATSQLQSYLYRCELRILLHLGNDVLAVLGTIYPTCNDNDEPTHLDLYPFKVELNGDSSSSSSSSKEVLVTPLPSKIYRLPTRCCAFLYHPF